jgi:hypothetical protein
MYAECSFHLTSVFVASFLSFCFFSRSQIYGWINKLLRHAVSDTNVNLWNCPHLHLQCRSSTNRYVTSRSYMNRVLWRRILYISKPVTDKRFKYYSDKPLRTVRPICKTGVPLPSRCCILYVFSTNISTEYFKYAAHSPFFFSKCRLFHNSTFFGSCIILILHTGCAKI